MWARENLTVQALPTLSVAPDSKGHVHATKESADTGNKSGFQAIGGNDSELNVHVKCSVVSY